ncbi:MAG: hypothetical protein ACTSXA_05895 [Candidatus Heimdallarchaeota archaeon]
MSKSFSNEIIKETKVKIRSLKEEYVYCPVCGTKNFQRIGSSLEQQRCSDCSERINDHWGKYQNGAIKTVMCISCLEPTFEPYYYCISCGYRQKKHSSSILYEDKGRVGRRKGGIKAGYIGREKAWFAFISNLLFGILLLTVGGIFFFYAAYISINDSDYGNKLLIIAFSIMSIGFVFGIIPAAVNTIVVNYQYDKLNRLEEEPSKDKRKIREII